VGGHRLLGQLLGDVKRYLLAALDPLGQPPDALRHPLHMPIGELLLHPGGQVLGLWDLDLRARVKPPSSGLGGQCVASLILLEER